MKHSTLLYTQKLYRYHSKELKIRLLYTLLTITLTFFTAFFHMEFILYKFSLLNFVDSFNKNLNLNFLNNLHSLDLPSWTKFIHFKIQTLKSLSYSERSFLEENLNSLDITLDPSTSLNSVNQTPGFIFTEIFEAFFSYLTFAGYFSFLFCLPIIYYHIYKFLLPGLSFSEKTILKSFFILSIFLISFAQILTYNLIVPYAISFFLAFQSNLNIFSLTEMPIFTNIESLTNTSYLGDFLVNTLKATQSVTHSNQQDTFNTVSFLGRIYPWITFLMNIFTLVSFLFQVPLFLLVSFILFTKLTSFNTNITLSSNNVITNPVSDTESYFFLSKDKLSTLLNTKFARKLLFFVLLLLTAIFSPPDLYSQFILLIPLFFVVEVFIFIFCIYIEYLKSTKV